MGISPLDFFFPRRCLGCGQSGVYFCPKCIAKMSLTKKQICPVCGYPTDQGKTHFPCLRSSPLDGLFSIFLYEGIVKKAIKMVKYRFVSDLAEALVELASQNFALGIEKAIVVPVPLSSQRQKWRGFNQAEVLGKIFARKYNFGFNHQLVTRTINNQPQVGLSAKEREKNVENVFQVVDGRLAKGKSLIVFDDVWTTGATLKSCSQTLKEAGAEKVWGLVLAR